MSLPTDPARAPSIFDGQIRLGTSRTFCGRCKADCVYVVFADPNDGEPLSERRPRAWCPGGQHGATRLVAVVLATRLLAESGEPVDAIS